MELRTLRYFATVARGATVAEAARRHCVTQPAVTAQLRRLEATVGERLFVRRGRRLAPTALARQILPRVEDVVARADALEAAIDAMRGLDGGTLRVGNIDAASIYVLPDVYRAFRERHPAVRIEIRVDDSRHLLEALRRGDVELATTTLPVDDADLVVREIHRETLAVVAAPSHPIAREGAGLPGALAGADLITYPAGSMTRALVDAGLREAGVVVPARMELSSPEAMRRLAEAGLGVTILPEAVVREALAAGTLVRLEAGLRIERAIGLVHRGHDVLSPAARAFVAMLDARGPDAVQ